MITTPLRCLIADDDPVIQKLMSSMLKKFGWHCDIVANGQEAIDAAAQTSYQLIFMDCTMPICDGLAATRNIRTKDRNTPIVAITSANNEVECSLAGMTYYIAKPIREADIKLALEFLDLRDNKSA